MTVNKQALNDLADYLLALPANYEGFDMGDFSYHPEKGWEVMYDGNNNPLCGTVGCALGHLPYVKGGKYFDETKDYVIESSPDLKFYYISWRYYSQEELGIEDSTLLWEFLFSGDWRHQDNTPQGAGKRIKYYLKYGLPNVIDDDYDWTYNLCDGELDLSFYDEV